METKRRETTLEVLKRLQAQNKRPIPDIYKKPPVIIKVEDIIDDDRIEFNKLKTKIVPSNKQSESVLMLKGIKDVEKKLQTGKNYFDFYYDLRRKEDELLKLYESYNDKDKLPEEVIKKVKEIKRKLSKL